MAKSNFLMIFEVNGVRYYVRTTKGLQDKLFVSEVDSIAEIVRNADIVLI